MAKSLMKVTSLLSVPGLAADGKGIKSTCMVRQSLQQPENHRFLTFSQAATCCTAFQRGIKAPQL